MKILVRGQDPQIEEFNQKFNGLKSVQFDVLNAEGMDLSGYQVIFDFFLDDTPQNLDEYVDLEGVTVFCDAVKTTLGEFSFYLDNKFRFTMAGFNGMRSFLNREILEVSILNRKDRDHVLKICADLGTRAVIVEDRVGMVTPRVICMIINEAFYTYQEGTADKDSIDLAMKLGTNYPYGPFEWAKRIGIENVYELLEAIYEDTKDERYKICPALKRDYMLGQ